MVPQRPKPLIRQPEGVSLSLSRNELATIVWLADDGFSVVTAPNATYRRSIEQVSHQHATAYASLIDKFERMRAGPHGLHAPRTVNVRISCLVPRGTADGACDLPPSGGAG